MRAIKALIALLFISFLAGKITRSANSIKDDEQVIFFPTLGRLSSDGLFWHARIHGWIFEHDAKNVEKLSLFKQRRRWFTVDNEGGKRITVSIAGKQYQLAKSAPNGHFMDEIRLPVAATPSARLVDNKQEILDFYAPLESADLREFRGAVLLVPPKGISVVSDIDDTIKISQVENLKALLRNTFLLSFKDAPGMVAEYRQLAKHYSAVFHYVTSSPWQLYPPLSEFQAEKGFPSGSFHMKTFRWADRSFFNLFKGARKHKTEIIEQLFNDFSQRGFILIGDSGEQDAEIYADLARRYPDRVVAILIRDTGAERKNKQNYKQIFAAISPRSWRVFADPAEISAFLGSRLQR